MWHIGIQDFILFIMYFTIVLDFIQWLYSSYISSILETVSIGNASLLKILSVTSQVLSREREIQKTRDIKEDFSSKIHDVSEKLKAISAKFKEKSPDVDHAKDEVKVRTQMVLVYNYNCYNETTLGKV